MTDKQLIDAFIAHNQRLAGKSDQLKAVHSAIWSAISELAEIFLAENIQAKAGAPKL